MDRMTPRSFIAPLLGVGSVWSAASRKGERSFHLFTFVLTVMLKGKFIHFACFWKGLNAVVESDCSRLCLEGKHLSMAGVSNIWHAAQNRPTWGSDAACVIITKYETFLYINRIHFQFSLLKDSCDIILVVQPSWDRIVLCEVTRCLHDTPPDRVCSVCDHQHLFSLLPVIACC